MKYLTFLVSFFAYVSVHILRMGYSSIKQQFETTFELNNMFLGLFDGLIYISLGLGFFFRFLISGNSKKTQMHLIFTILTVSSYLVIPMLGLIYGNNKVLEIDGTSIYTIGDVSFFIRYFLPGLSLIIFGFCQFTAWPTLLYLVNQHFTIQKEGSILGIWSANGDVGNVLGFICGLIIMDSMQAKWQIVMIFGAVIHLFTGILVYLLLKDLKQTPKMNTLLGDSVVQQIKQNKVQKFKQFLRFSLQVIKLNENKLYLLAMGFLKAILYGFLLWMPTYLKHQTILHPNYPSWTKSWAPSAFNIATIFGSALLGYFYKQQKNYQIQDYNNLPTYKKVFIKIVKHLSYFSLFYSCIIIGSGLLIFFLQQTELVQTMILSCVIGLFLGGSFNMLAGNQIIAITKGDQQKVDMLSTLSMTTGNIIVGIVEIIIGLALNVKKDFSKQKNLFIVLLTICGLTISILFFRSMILHKKQKQELIDVGSSQI